MYGVDLYRQVRLACHREGLSRREASRQFGIDRKTVAKILLHSEPPGYRRRQPPKRPKLAPFTDIIDGILEEDRTVHRKQRHTAKRIFERLRDEHGFTGKQTIVKDYVRELDPSRKSGGALHRLHCFCLEFDGACEVQRRVPTDWVIEPIDVSGYGSFSLAS